MKLTRILALPLAVLLAACGGAPAATTATPTTPGSSAATPATTAAASDYRDGDTLTIVVPYTTGGGFDLGARILQPYLQTALKQVTGKSISLIVQNVPGAGGRVGDEQVWKAAPDGRTLLYTTQVDMAGFQVRGSPIDIAKWTQIAQVSNQALAFIVPPNVIPATGGFKDLVDRSKQKAILYGYTAPDQAKLTMALLKDAMGMQLSGVPFPGTGEAQASLLRGEIELYTVSLATALQLVQQNPTWRIVAQSGATRDATAATIPTLAEAGMAQSAADQINTMADTTTRTIHGPPGISAANTKALQDAFKIAINDPGFVKDMTAKSQPVAYAGPDVVAKTAGAAVALFTKYKDVLLAP
jgi:tripartite-type tricarboxylate transporter receptor subunit TctC